MESVEYFLEFVLEKYQDRIVDVFKFKPEPYDFVKFEVNSELKKRLQTFGIKELYEHQAEAINELFNSNDVCVVSSTASGKSLVYLLPMLKIFLEDPSSTFLLIFPTKSLSQDQIKNIVKLIPEANPAVYDGDTPLHLRKFIRDNSRVIATNPDMIHYGILPNHHLWANFFRNLKLIVVDEMHVYRGAFGSNAAFVFRRLLRIANLYRSQPLLVLTSATIGNPEEVAKQLFNKEFYIVKTNKIAPLTKTFVFWNPPFDSLRNRRFSSNSDSIAIFSDAIRLGFRTIVFSKSKQTAEIIAKHAKERVGKGIEDKIAVYRAGLLPERRREIERKLFNGEIIGVSTTPALELGIDIGDLSIAIINRFPGTVSSFFQQSGRVGRRQSSLVFFIAGEDPLDQYYVTHGNELLSKPRENAIVDLSNEYISENHLLSAAFEHPLKRSEFGIYFDSEHIKLIIELKKKQLVKEAKSRIYLAPGVRRPHDRVSLRTTTNEFYSIIDIKSGEFIGTMEGSLAFFYLHPGAVYLHEASTYLVKDLNLEKRVALVERVEEIPYYTLTLEETQVDIIERKYHQVVGKFNVYFGKLRVSTQVIGYNKKHSLTDEVLAFIPLDLPPMEFVTQGLWFDLEVSEIQKLKLDEASLAGGIHGIEHAHIAILPYFAGCDRWDIGGLSTPYHPDTLKTTIFVYDGYEGGIGYSEKGFEYFPEHIGKTAETIEMCPCINGCPSCIVSPKCGNNNEPLDKNSAISILKAHLK